MHVIQRRKSVPNRQPAYLLYKMTAAKRTILITGCNDDGLGATLAQAFHSAGLEVIATARNTGKMKTLEQAGIKATTPDVLSETSICECVGKVSKLDILVNNAGAGFSGPSLLRRRSHVPKSCSIYTLQRQ